MSFLLYWLNFLWLCCCLFCVLIKFCLPSLNQGAPSSRNYKTYVHDFVSFQGQVKTKIIRQMSIIKVHCLLKSVPICLNSFLYVFLQVLLLYKAISIALFHLSNLIPHHSRALKILKAHYETRQDIDSYAQCALIYTLVPKVI